MLILRHLPARASPPTALTVGNFDGVHLGHRAMLSLLKQAAEHRALTSCVMTFEPHPQEFFSPDRAPTRLTSLREKLELLAPLGVNQVHVRRFDYDFARLTAGEFIDRILIKELQVRWMLVGDDFRFGARRQGDIGLLCEAGLRHSFEVVRMDSFLIDGIRVSSTAVRERLAHGDLGGAARLLGRPYCMSGRVVRGDGLGKQLGFPTANIQIKHNRPPLYGIFVVEVAGIQSQPIEGVASLGTRPTVRQGGVPVLEVHLFDFVQDIYGRHLQVRFLHKLRDEEIYPDLAALKAQIGRDVEDARRWLRQANRSHH